jgi:muramoyltetrapeptide carboxypeptidase
VADGRRFPAHPPRGGTVSLVAPAGPVSGPAIDRAVERVRSLGWEPVLGRHARERRGYLAGTDAERADDLNSALRDPENAAIWFLRGGYGTLRILDRVAWDALEGRPRPLIGFSDNTALHLAAFRRGLVTFHGPHAAAPEFPEFTARSLVQVLDPAGADSPLPLPDEHRAIEVVNGGIAEGVLVGGNLAMLAATLATPVQLRASGAILFLEEVGEAAYRVDRLLTQLRLAGVLDAVAGIAIGAISACTDAAVDGNPSVTEIVADRTASLGVPVLSGLPFGHEPESWTLPIGIRARLDADRMSVQLLEPATR